MEGRKICNYAQYDNKRSSKRLEMGAIILFSSSSTMKIAEMPGVWLRANRGVWNVFNPALSIVGNIRRAAEP